MSHGKHYICTHSVCTSIAHHEHCHQNRLFSKYVSGGKAILDLLVDQEEMQKLDEDFSTHALYLNVNIRRWMTSADCLPRQLLIPADLAMAINHTILSSLHILFMNDTELIIPMFVPFSPTRSPYTRHSSRLSCSTPQRWDHHRIILPPNQSPNHYQ